MGSDKEEKTLEAKNPMPVAKKKKIIQTIAAVTVVVLLSVFFGVFYGIRSQPDKKLARAIQEWNEATTKSTSDQVNLVISIGEGEAKLLLKIDLKGSRLFDGDKATFNYTAGVDFLLDGNPITLIVLEFKADIDTDVRIRVNAIEGFLRKDFKNIDKSFPRTEADKYSFDHVTFYSMDTMSVNNKGSYTIEGANSFDFILDQLAPVLEKVTEMDILSLIKDYITPGGVRGQIIYEKGNFKEMTGQQNISAYIPWEELDSKLESVTLPEKLREILATRTVSFSIFQINIEEAYCPTGFAMNIKIDSKSTYASKE